MLQDVNLATQVAQCTSCRLAVDRGGLSVPASSGSFYQPGGLALFLEAPGAEEEKLHTSLSNGAQIGKPLVGRSGTFMDQLLLIAGINREEILVLNRIRCRPPRNRIDDYPDAVAQCDEWVKKELALYDPAVVICCGNTALRSIFEPSASITAFRGILRSTPKEHPYGARVFSATFHPAYALRNGGLKSQQAVDIVKDIKTAMSLL